MNVLLRWKPHRTIEFAFGFQWKDIWFGLFIDPTADRLRVYLILIPCFPLRLTWDR